MFQRLLPLAMREDYSLAKWVMAPCNEVAARWVLRASNDPFMACLAGETQAGKTHLGHIFAQLRNGVVLSRVEAEEVRRISAREVFEQFPLAQSFVFDPFEAWPEAWLFDAFNLLKERRVPTLWIAARPVQRWTFTLPDWESRLRSLPLLTVGLPDDVLRRQIFLKRMYDCGVKIDEDAVDELLNQIPRTWEALQRWTIRLDRMSSLLKKRISKGFIRDLLREEESDAEREIRTESFERK